MWGLWPCSACVNNLHSSAIKGDGGSLNQRNKQTGLQPQHTDTRKRQKNTNRVFHLHANRSHLHLPPLSSWWPSVLCWDQSFRFRWLKVGKRGRSASRLDNRKICWALTRRRAERMRAVGVCRSGPNMRSIDHLICGSRRGSRRAARTTGAPSLSRHVRPKARRAASSKSCRPSRRCSSSLTLAHSNTDKHRLKNLRKTSTQPLASSSSFPCKYIYFWRAARDGGRNALKT